MRLLRVAARELLPFWAKRFDTSENYWKRRYWYGGNSGSGSGGASAAYKAAFVNSFCRQQGVRVLGEIGCGDGRNAALLRVAHYTGYDISEDALRSARGNAPGREFLPMRMVNDHDAMLSMDVVYHLVESGVFSAHLRLLANHADRFVLIYGTDHDASGMRHVRHRRTSAHFLDINPGWHKIATIDNPLYGDAWREHPHFMVFARSGVALSPAAAPSAG